MDPKNTDLISLLNIMLHFLMQWIKKKSQKRLIFLIRNLVKIAYKILVSEMHSSRSGSVNGQNFHCDIECQAKLTSVHTWESNASVLENPRMWPHAILFNLSQHQMLDLVLRLSKVLNGGTIAYEEDHNYDNMFPNGGISAWKLILTLDNNRASSLVYWCHVT